MPAHPRAKGFQALGKAIRKNEHPQENVIKMRVLNYSVDFGKLAFVRLKIRFKYFRKKDYEGFAFFNTN